MWTLQTLNTDISTVKLVSTDRPADRNHQIFLRVDRFALTSNVITYAILGDELGYWQLFPADQGWGHVPTWGFAEVISSSVEGIASGARYFGLVPMASHFTMTGSVSRLGFRARDDHRVDLNPVYNQYAAVDIADENTLGLKALLHPLFITSNVLHRYLSENDWFGAEQIIVTSASSKTAIGFAFLARASISLIGATSKSNEGFVRSLALHDRVYTYSDIFTAFGQPSVLIDFSGDRTRLAKLAAQEGAENLRRIIQVGYTHVEQSSTSTPPLRDTRAEVFWAPGMIETYVRRDGPDQFDAELSQSLQRFAQWIKMHTSTSYIDGPDSLANAYRRLYDGKVRPTELLIARPNR